MQPSDALRSLSRIAVLPTNCLAVCSPDERCPCVRITTFPAEKKCEAAKIGDSSAVLLRQPWVDPCRPRQLNRQRQDARWMPRVQQLSMRTRFDMLFQNTIVRYLFGIIAIAVTIALRMWLIPVNGTGAPFVLFFTAVLATSLIAGV